MKLGHATFEIVFRLLEILAATGQSLIVEANFIPTFHTERLIELEDKYGFQTFQVLCTADKEALVRRFKKRCESGERHPGHVDHLTTDDQLEDFLRPERHAALGIGGTLFEIDTTDFETIDYQALVAAVRSTYGRITPQVRRETDRR